MLSIRLVAADKEEPLGHDGCDSVLLWTLWGGEGGKLWLSVSRTNFCVFLTSKHLIVKGRRPH